MTSSFWSRRFVVGLVMFMLLNLVALPLVYLLYWVIPQQLAMGVLGRRLGWGDYVAVVVVIVLMCILYDLKRAKRIKSKKPPNQSLQGTP